MEDNAKTLKWLYDAGKEDWKKTKTHLPSDTPSVFKLELSGNFFPLPLQVMKQTLGSYISPSHFTL